MRKNRNQEKKKCHEDGQQKSHRPHTRPTTLSLRKRRKLYYIILYYIILYYIRYIKKVKLTLRYKYLQKYLGDYRVAKKSASPFFSTTS